MMGTKTKWDVLVVLAAFAMPAAIVPAAVRAQTDSTTSSTDDAAPADEAAADEAAADAAADEAAAEEAAPAEEAAGEASTEEAAATDESASALASGELCPDGQERNEAGECVDIDRARSEAEAEEAQATTEPLAWRNSFFSWTMGSTFNTFYRGADLSYNPLYYWTFNLAPRWYLSSNVFFFVSQTLYYELTNDDGATYNHEPQLFDTIVDLRATFVADRFIFIPAVRVTLPVSKLSQAAQRYLQTAIGLTTVVNLPEVASGNLALVLRYGRWWGASNVSLTGGPVPLATTDSTGGIAPNGAPTAAAADTFGDGQADGTTLGVDIFTTGLQWNLTPVEGFTVTASAFFLFVNGYSLAEPTFGVMGNPMAETLEDLTSHWRVFTSYTVQAAYDIAPWFNLAVGVSNATNLSPFFSADGNVLSPFNPNTQVFLSGTVTLDGLYETITAGGEDDGLTPEERQRRRQGLAALEPSDEEFIADESDADGEEEDDESGAARATGTF